jgi:hypothetical protein
MGPNPPYINMAAFFLGKGVVVFPVESPSGLLTLVKVPVVMWFFIMVHSFSLCPTGYV